MYLIDLIGPVSTIFILAILAVSVLCFATMARDKVLIGLALILSMVGGQAATFSGVTALTTVSLSVAAVLCLMAGTVGALCIAFIYGIRLIVAAFTLGGYIPVNYMWEISFVAVFFQLVLALGTIWGSGTLLPAVRFVTVLNRKKSLADMFQTPMT